MRFPTSVLALSIAAFANAQTSQLNEAAKSGDLRRIEALFKIGETDPAGEALFAAASSGQSEAVFKLIDLGSPLNSSKYNVLAAAVSKCNAQTVKLLLQKGANPNIYTNGKNQLAHKLVFTTIEFRQKADILIEYKIKFMGDDLRDVLGDTNEPADKNFEKLTDYILKSGVDPNAALSWQAGWGTASRAVLPIYWATIYGTPSTICSLIRAGANPNCQVEAWQAFLFVQSFKRLPETLTPLNAAVMLLADNLTGTLGGAAWREKRSKHLMDVIEALAEGGANPMINNSLGISASDLVDTLPAPYAEPLRALFSRTKTRASSNPSR